MSSEMIEKVARAISASFREEGAFWDGKWETEVEQAEFHKAARAAIEATRRPTKAMKEAADLLDPQYDDPPVYGVDYWAAMIDAALKE